MVCFAVFCFSGYKVISLLADYRKADVFYESVQQEYVQVVPTTQPTSHPAEQTAPTDQTKSSAPIRVDFSGLLSVNKDVVGWLYCPDTVVNYPVVQAGDNKTYLHADLSGEYLRSGTLFADCDNEGPVQNRNYIVYGHSMKNGSMFGMLLDYKKQSYYDQHPVWYYLTPDGNYRIELIAGCVVKTTRDIYTPILNAKVMVRELGVLEEMSTFQSETTYTEEDSFITLSTCSYEFNNARYVLVGKLIPLNE
jgi:sortase B